MAEAASKKISELNDGGSELTTNDITVIVQNGETRKVSLLRVLQLLGFPITFEDVLDCSSNPNYPAATKGQMWLCTEGKVGGADGKKVENGEMIICKVASSPEGDYATVGANWSDFQTNIDVDLYALNAEVFHNNVVAEINALTGKTTPVDADLVVIEDSASDPAYGKKKLTWANLKATIRSALGMSFLKFAGTSTSEKTYTAPDVDSVLITNQPAEISGFTEKTTPVDADIIPIEDSASSPVNQKKKVSWTNIKATLRRQRQNCLRPFASASCTRRRQ